MVKAGRKPKFLPDLTAPSHKDLRLQAVERKNPTKKTSGSIADRISSDTPPVIDKDEFDALVGQYKTKSAVIRALASRNIPTNMIAHTLLFHGMLSPMSAYQHAYNVLRHPLKRLPKATSGTDNTDNTNEG